MICATWGDVAAGTLVGFWLAAGVWFGLAFVAHLRRQRRLRALADEWGGGSEVPAAWSHSKPPQ